MPSSRCTTLYDPWRCEDLPIPFACSERFPPLLKTGFAVVNLLPSADQRDHNCPIFMPLPELQHPLRLRVVAAKLAHILRQVPRSLGFIENDDVIRWGSSYILIGIGSSEDVNILNQSLRLKARFRRRHFVTHRLLTKEFLQNCNERTVSTHKVNSVCTILTKVRK